MATSEWIIIYKPTFHSPTLLCCNFPNQKITHFKGKKNPQELPLHNVLKKEKKEERIKDHLVWIHKNTMLDENNKKPQKTKTLTLTRFSESITACLFWDRAPSLAVQLLLFMRSGKCTRHLLLQQNQIRKILEQRASISCYLEGKFLLWKGAVFLRQKVKKKKKQWKICKKLFLMPQKNPGTLSLSASSWRWGSWKHLWLTHVFGAGRTMAVFDSLWL